MEKILNNSLTITVTTNSTNFKIQEMRKQLEKKIDKIEVQKIF